MLKKRDLTYRSLFYFQIFNYGAGNGDRTRGIKLGKLALYQLSYARNVNNLKRFIKINQDFFIAIVLCLSKI